MPIRVSVLDLPAMLTAIVKDILGRSDDVSFVEPPSEPVDVVIVAAGADELPPTGTAALARSPAAKVLTISAEGRRAYLYELRVQRTPLGELSASSLLAAVRSAAGRAPG